MMYAMKKGNKVHGSNVHVNASRRANHDNTNETCGFYGYKDVCVPSVTKFDAKDVIDGRSNIKMKAKDKQ